MPGKMQMQALNQITKEKTRKSVCVSSFTLNCDVLFTLHVHLISTACQEPLVHLDASSPNRYPNEHLYPCEPSTLLSLEQPYLHSGNPSLQQMIPNSVPPSCGLSLVATMSLMALAVSETLSWSRERGWMYTLPMDKSCWTLPLE